MLEWYGEKYWGAAHGLTGIMDVLMDMELKSDEVEDVKGTLKYMINNRFPSGNYPASEEDRKRDVLVHWCHGAPGISLTLAKAAKVFGDQEFLEAAVDTAELVWKRGLLKRVGICHGISWECICVPFALPTDRKSRVVIQSQSFCVFSS